MTTVSQWNHEDALDELCWSVICCSAHTHTQRERERERKKDTHTHTHVNSNFCFLTDRLTYQRTEIVQFLRCGWKVMLKKRDDVRGCIAVSRPILWKRLQSGIQTEPHTVPNMTGICVKGISKMTVSANIALPVVELFWSSVVVHNVLTSSVLTLFASVWLDGWWLEGLLWNLPEIYHVARAHSQLLIVQFIIREVGVITLELCCVQREDNCVSCRRKFRSWIVDSQSKN